MTITHTLADKLRAQIHSYDIQIAELVQLQSERKKLIKALKAIEKEKAPRIRPLEGRMAAIFQIMVDHQNSISTEDIDVAWRTKYGEPHDLTLARIRATLFNLKEWGLIIPLKRGVWRVAEEICIEKLLPHHIHEEDSPHLKDVPLVASR